MPQGAPLALKPKVHVRLPGVLTDLFPGSPRAIDVEARTIAEMIEALDTLWPGMADRIRDSRPAIRKHINIFIDGERAKLTTPLSAGAEVFVLTAISGG